MRLLSYMSHTLTSDLPGIWLNQTVSIKMNDLSRLERHCGLIALDVAPVLRQSPDLTVLDFRVLKVTCHRHVI